MSTIHQAQRDAINKVSPGIDIRFEGDKRYEEARVWGARNTTHPYRPAAIAFPKATEEVAALVKWASRSKISLCVSSGGHSGLGFTKTLVIRMDEMNSAVVDTTAMPPRVTCGGGCRASQVDAACEPHGLATTLGNCGMVGVAGVLMGGGTGYCARWQGLAIDQLLAATLVLANGSVVDVSERANSDLFWAIKGGGGNFGVIVSFTMRCFALGWDEPNGRGRLLGGMRVLFKDRVCCGGNPGGLLGILGQFRAYAQAAPDEASCEMMLPCGAPICVQFFSYKGPLDMARAEAAKWKALGSAVYSNIKVQSYHSELQGFVAKMDGARQLKGYSERWVSILTDLNDAALAILAREAASGAKGAGQSVIMLQRLGGKVDRPAAGAASCAFAHRGAGYWLVLSATTSEDGQPEAPEKAVAAEAWLQRIVAELTPHILGPASAESRTGCIAPISSPAVAGVTPMAPANVFGGKRNVQRLHAIKVKYDPKNVFAAVESGMTGAHNIDPTKKPVV